MKPTLGLSTVRLRWLLVFGELFLVAALALMATRTELTLVMLLPLGIGVVLSFLRWPSLGLIVAAVAGLIVPYTGPSGLNVTMILVALLLGLWIFDLVVNQGRVQLARSRTIAPLLCFVMSAVISFGAGQLPWLSFALHAPLGAQLGGMAVIVLSAGIFLLMANQIHDIQWLSRLTWAVLAVATLSLLFRSILPAFGLPTRNFFLQVGTVFYVALVAMAFSQAAFNKDLRLGWRLALGTLVLVTLYVLFVFKFDDKSGWLSAFVCIVAILGARSWRVGLTLSAVGIVLALAMQANVVGTDEYSITTRFDAWEIMGKMIRISPVLGLGFANYYSYAPLFPIRGYAVSFNSHNNYIDIIAQMGVVGLLCFLWLLFEIGRLAWSLRDKVPSGFAQAYVYGAFGLLAGMAVAGFLGDWILPFFYNIGLRGLPSSMLGWLFLGGLVSLGRMYPSPAS